MRKFLVAKKLVITVIFFLVSSTCLAMDSQITMRRVYSSFPVHFVKPYSGCSSYQQEIADEVAAFCKYATANNITNLIFYYHGTAGANGFYRGATQGFAEGCNDDKKLIIVSHPDDERTRAALIKADRTFSEQMPYVAVRVSVKSIDVNLVIRALHTSSELVQNRTAVFIPYSGQLFNAMRDTKDVIKAMKPSTKNKIKGTKPKAFKGDADQFIKDLITR